ncbi:proteasome subunit alpha [Actinospica durhamensis]|uniref:Proteasome subunit alpha n=1 Tax=Actinospica durhamensis TaxID=1508375 RepID=A0A941ER81_9ACTN|nr:proteasome subunit alpha [Actinospica durhamensis]MBR7833634.1 proteasome subunit alpha [Actinospica durhamensis]
MTTPFYVSPEQLMKDRADFVRKNIARGGSAAVLHYDGGILFVAENRSRVLHKVSEIYDRIGFAAAGKYNEFENLRQAGVRLADSRGYLYDRRDVTALGLANAYAQLLGNIFSESGAKPYEAELVIAEVGDRPEQDQIYRIPYDGSVVDSHGFVVIGGAAEAVSAVLTETYQETPGLGEALRIAVAALGRDGTETRELSPAQLEVAVLDRNRKQPRKFRRLLGAQLAALLQDAPGADAAALVENGESAGASAAEREEPGTDTAAPAAATAADGDEDSGLDTNALIDEALDEDSGRGEDNGDN